MGDYHIYISQCSTHGEVKSKLVQTNNKVENFIFKALKDFMEFV